MDAHVISLANQKGGTAKTTTCANLGIGLAQAGRKVLLVDADAQGSLTLSLGWEPDELPITLYDLMIKAIQDKSVTHGEGMLHHEEGVDLLPANIELAGMEHRERVMTQMLENAKDDFDYIFIDCPPSLGLITLNALCAADGVLIPIQCEYYALEGVSALMGTIQKVQKMNRHLAIEGVVLTMFDARTNLGVQVAQEVRKVFKNKVYKTVIPRNVRLGEAPSHGLPIHLYDPRSLGAQSYQQLAKEFLEREQ